MDRRYPGKDPTQRAIGWAVVITLHLAVGYLVVTGMVRKGVDFLKKPLEAAVIQEVIIPPPPPPKEIKPPEPKQVKSEAPPPPFIPPPDVAAPSTAPAIASVATPPPVMAPIAPPPPPAPPAPAPGPPPAPPAPPRPVDIGVVCPTMVQPEIPRQAQRENIEGIVRAQVSIKDGAVKEVSILSGPRVYHAAVRTAMLQYKCVTGSAEVTATQEFVFKFKD